MKKYFIPLLIFLFPFISNAHSEGDTVLYSILRNKPNTSYYGAGISYDFAMNAYNGTMVALGLDGTFMHEKFSVNFYSRYHLFEYLADYAKNEPYTRSVYEAEHSRDISFLGSYYFINEIRKHDETVTLGSRGSVQVVTEIPCDYSHRYGIDLGFASGVTYYNFQEDEAVEATDNSGNAAILSNQNEKSISSYYKNTYLKIGVNRTLVSQLVIQTDTYGKKSSNRNTTIYGQAFIGLNGGIDDVYVPYDYATPDNGPYTLHTITTGFNRIGGCIGWATYEQKTKSSMAVGTNLELGIFPGPKTAVINNLYLNFKFRFHFARYI